MSTCDIWYVVEVTTDGVTSNYRFFDLKSFYPPNLLSYHYLSDGKSYAFWVSSQMVLPAYWSQLFKGKVDSVSFYAIQDGFAVPGSLRVFTDVNLSLYKKGLCGSLFINNTTRLWIENPEDGLVCVA